MYQKSKGVPQTMQRENGKDLGSGIDRGGFGNDNEATNEIAGEMFTFIANEIESYRSKFGTMTPGILPVSGNTPFGLEVGALPSGRHAWKPLADEVSPNGGTDTEGPGAVLKSVSHLPHDRFVQGTLLNMKIEPEMLNSENGIMQMMALLKSMCSLGIFHVQFNVIDRETSLAVSALRIMRYCPDFISL